LSETPDTADWDGVRVALRDRMRELGVSTAELARRTGLSETTIRGIGQAGKTSAAVLITISAVLRWRYDHLTNIARGQPEKNVRITPPPSVTTERVVRAELAPLREQVQALRETVLAIDRTLTLMQAGPPGRPATAETPIAALPAPNDMDADYSPQYVKLARRLRRRIESGAIRPLSPVRAADLSAEYGVSAPVALAALDMLAANGYMYRPDRFHAYEVRAEGGDG